MSTAVPLMQYIVPLAGAGAGALLDKENPLGGAYMGGLMGAVAAPSIGAMAASMGASGGLEGLLGAPTYATALAGADVSAEQAGMLAAQTAELGPEALADTAAAAEYAAKAGTATLPPASQPKDDAKTAIKGLGSYGMAALLGGMGQQRPTLPPPPSPPTFHAGPTLPFSNMRGGLMPSPYATLGQRSVDPAELMRRMGLYSTGAPYQYGS